MADNSKSEKKDNKPSFWQGVKAEWGKIIWTDRSTLVKQTILVTLISVLMGVIIAVADGAFLQLIELIIG